MDPICPSCGASSKSPYVCLNCGEPLGNASPSPASDIAPLSDVDRAFAALDAEADAEIDSADAAARRRALARWMPSNALASRGPSAKTQEDEAIAALAAEMGVAEVTARPQRPRRTPAPEQPPTGTITEADRAFARLSAEIEDGEPLAPGGAPQTFSKRPLLIGIAGVAAFSLVMAVAAMFYAPHSTTEGQLTPREAIMQDAQAMARIEKNATEQAAAPEADPRYVATGQSFEWDVIDDDRRADLRRLDKGDQAVIDASNAVAQHAEAFLKALGEGRDDDMKSEREATTAAMADLTKAISQPPTHPHP